MITLHRQPGSRQRGASSGFTLVEILVAAAVTVVLVGILLEVTTLTSNAVKQSSTKLTAFAAARTAFDVMTQKLSQATLNTYLDYYDGQVQRSAMLNGTTALTTSTFVPTSYGRASDLQFYIRQNVQNNSGSITGNHGQEVYFQAPEDYSDRASYQAIQGLLNVCGFYVAYGDSAVFQPSAVTTAGNHRYRYRLMQGLEPTENFSVFASNIANNSGTPAWISNVTNGASGPTATSQFVTPLADNIIALILWPRLSAEDDAAGTSLTTNYTYNSQFPDVITKTGSLVTQTLTADQLPPNIRVTMIAVDEPSMIRLNQIAGAPSPLNGTSTPPTKIETALAGRFTDVTQYTNDLSAVITSLSAAKISFQVFDATVVMRESKWSQNPAN